MDLESYKTAVIGLGSAICAGATGWLAFGRYMMRVRAGNSNDNQQINMLQFLSDQLKEAKSENAHLRDEIEHRDQTIREYWKTISETESRLQIVESQLEALKEQNEALKAEIQELIASSTNMACQLARITNGQEVPVR
ncbi:hypothetical protein BTJ39_22355 [Izhakiella australiensis]|uniref:Uncharacterized protein n=2 Tax=Izhakiella australiensis TaxID=1926881 RepID=A0A1S8Y923_9GAMM|nr:hypothetical protein BTJ39_22355 [Izhakiella australiensis]